MAEEEQQPGDASRSDASQGSVPPGAESMSEEEMRAAYEEQIKKVRVEDLVLQSAVSILQLSARRIAKEDEKDLDQARAGIDAASALIEHTPEEAQAELRQAVSDLKLLFAQHSGEGGGADGGGEEGEEAPKPPDPPKPSGDSGLWTPGSG